MLTKHSNIVAFVIILFICGTLLAQDTNSEQPLTIDDPVEVIRCENGGCYHTPASGKVTIADAILINDGTEPPGNGDDGTEPYVLCIAGNGCSWATMNPNTVDTEFGGDGDVPLGPPGLSAKDAAEAVDPDSEVEEGLFFDEENSFAEEIDPNSEVEEGLFFDEENSFAEEIDPDSPSTDDGEAIAEAIDPTDYQNFPDQPTIDKLMQLVCNERSNCKFTDPSLDLALAFGIGVDVTLEGNWTLEQGELNLECTGGGPSLTTPPITSSASFAPNEAGTQVVATGLEVDDAGDIAIGEITFNEMFQGNYAASLEISDSGVTTTITMLILMQSETSIKGIIIGKTDLADLGISCNMRRRFNGTR